MKKIVLISALAAFIFISNVGCYHQFSNSLYNVFGSTEAREIIRSEKLKVQEGYSTRSAEEHPVKLLRMFSRINPKIKIKL